MTRDLPEDAPDSAVPPWWCGRCDGSKCVDCASARVALERKRRNAPDDADCDEEIRGELKRAGRWRGDP